MVAVREILSGLANEFNMALSNGFNNQQDNAINKNQNPNALQSKLFNQSNLPSLCPGLLTNSQDNKKEFNYFCLSI